MDKLNDLFSRIFLGQRPSGPVEDEQNVTEQPVRQAGPVISVETPRFVAQPSGPARQAAEPQPAQAPEQPVILSDRQQPALGGRDLVRGVDSDLQLNLRRKGWTDEQIWMLSPQGLLASPSLRAKYSIEEPPTPQPMLAPPEKAVTFSQIEQAKVGYIDSTPDGFRKQAAEEYAATVGKISSGKYSGEELQQLKLAAQYQYEAMAQMGTSAYLADSKDPSKTNRFLGLLQRLGSGLISNVTVSDKPLESNFLFADVFDASPDKPPFDPTKVQSWLDLVERNPMTSISPFVRSIVDWKDGNRMLQALKDGTLTETEAALVRAYMMKQMANGEVDSVAYDIGTTAKTMPAWIVEYFALKEITAPLHATLFAETAKGLSFLQKVGNVAVGSIPQALVAGALNPAALMAGAIERQVPSLTVEQSEQIGKVRVAMAKAGDDLNTAMAKSYGIQVTEFWTESLGDLLPKGGHVGLTEKLEERIIDAWGNKWYGEALFNSIEAAKAAAVKLGWNGLIGEVFEEEVAEPIEAAIDGKKYAAPWTKEGLRRVLTELGAIALTNVGVAGYGGITGSAPSLMTKVKEVRDKLRGAGDVPKSFEDAVAAAEKASGYSADTFAGAVALATGNIPDTEQFSSEAVPNVTVFSTEGGQVTPVQTGFGRVLDVTGDQIDLVTRLAALGVPEAVKLQADYDPATADSVIAGLLGQYYDAIRYTGEKGLSQEIHDLNNNKIYQTTEQAARDLVSRGMSSQLYSQREPREEAVALASSTRARRERAEAVVRRFASASQLPVRFVQMMFERTPDGGLRLNAQGQPIRAFGVYRTTTEDGRPEIVIADVRRRSDRGRVPDTARHEVGHWLWNNYVEADRKAEVLAEMRRQFPNLSDAALVEKLMDGFADYRVTNATAFGEKVRNFFAELVRIIKALAGVSPSAQERLFMEMEMRSSRPSPADLASAEEALAEFQSIRDEYQSEAEDAAHMDKLELPVLRIFKLQAFGEEMLKDPSGLTKGKVEEILASPEAKALGIEPRERRFVQTVLDEDMRGMETFSAGDFRRILEMNMLKTHLVSVRANSGSYSDYGMGKKGSGRASTVKGFGDSLDSVDTYIVDTDYVHNGRNRAFDHWSFAKGIFAHFRMGFRNKESVGNEKVRALLEEDVKDAEVREENVRKLIGLVESGAFNDKTERDFHDVANSLKARTRPSASTVAAFGEETADVIFKALHAEEITGVLNLGRVTSARTVNAAEAEARRRIVFWKSFEKERELRGLTDDVSAQVDANVEKAKSVLAETAEGTEERKAAEVALKAAQAERFRFDKARRQLSVDMGVGEAVEQRRKESLEKLKALAESERSRAAAAPEGSAEREGFLRKAAVFDAKIADLAAAPAAEPVREGQLNVEETKSRLLALAEEYAVRQEEGRKAVNFYKAVAEKDVDAMVAYLGELQSDFFQKSSPADGDEGGSIHALIKKQQQYVNEDAEEAAGSPRLVRHHISDKKKELVDAIRAASVVRSGTFSRSFLPSSMQAPNYAQNQERFYSSKGVTESIFSVMAFRSSKFFFYGKRREAPLENFTTDVTKVNEGAPDEAHVFEYRGTAAGTGEIAAGTFRVSRFDWTSGESYENEVAVVGKKLKLYEEYSELEHNPMVKSSVSEFRERAAHVFFVELGEKVSKMKDYMKSQGYDVILLKEEFLRHLDIRKKMRMEELALLREELENVSGSKNAPDRSASFRLTKLKLDIYQSIADNRMAGLAKYQAKFAAVAGRKYGLAIADKMFENGMLWGTTRRPTSMANVKPEVLTKVAEDMASRRGDDDVVGAAADFFSYAEGAHEIFYDKPLDSKELKLKAYDTAIATLRELAADVAAAKTGVAGKAVKYSEFTAKLSSDAQRAESVMSNIADALTKAGSAVNGRKLVQYDSTWYEMTLRLAIRKAALAGARYLRIADGFTSSLIQYHNDVATERIKALDEVKSYGDSEVVDGETMIYVDSIGKTGVYARNASLYSVEESSYVGNVYDDYVREQGADSADFNRRTGLEAAWRNYLVGNLDLVGEQLRSENAANVGRLEERLANHVAKFEEAETQLAALLERRDSLAAAGKTSTFIAEATKGGLTLGRSGDWEVTKDLFIIPQEEDATSENLDAAKEFLAGNGIAFVQDVITGDPTFDGRTVLKVNESDAFGGRVMDGSTPSVPYFTVREAIESAFENMQSLQRQILIDYGAIETAKSDGPVTVSQPSDEQLYDSEWMRDNGVAWNFANIVRNISDNVVAEDSDLLMELYHKSGRSRADFVYRTSSGKVLLLMKENEEGIEFVSKEGAEREYAESVNDIRREFRIEDYDSWGIPDKDVGIHYRMQYVFPDYLRRLRGKDAVRHVVDEFGQGWWEISITDEDKGPVEAYQSEGEIDSSRYNEGSKKFLEEFNTHNETETLGSVGYVRFVATDRTMAHLEENLRKEGFTGQRMPVSELKRIIPLLSSKHAYRGDPNPANYRHDTIVWLAKEGRALHKVFTYRNRFDNEEVLTWFTVTEPSEKMQTMKTLSRNGRPDAWRLANTSMEKGIDPKENAKLWAQLRAESDETFARHAFGSGKTADLPVGPEGETVKLFLIGDLNERNVPANVDRPEGIKAIQEAAEASLREESGSEEAQTRLETVEAGTFGEAKLLEDNGLNAGDLALRLTDGAGNALAFAKLDGTPIEVKRPEILSAMREVPAPQEQAVVTVATSAQRAINASVQPRFGGRLVTRKERTLLSERIRAYARGVKAGRADMRASLTEAFRMVIAQLEVMRQAIVTYAQRLPLEERGRMLNMVATAKTQRDLRVAFDRIDAAYDRAALREGTAQLREKAAQIRRASRTGRGIAVEYQKKLIALLDSYDLKTPTRATQASLRGLAEFVERNPDVRMPPSVGERLKRLSRLPVSALSSAAVAELNATIDSLIELGELKLKLVRYSDARKKEAMLERLVDSTRNLEKKNAGDMTGWEKRTSVWKMTYYQLLHFMRVADAIDGYKSYSGVNSSLHKHVANAETRARISIMEAEEKLLNAVNAVKRDWSEDDNVAITYHLMADMGAMAQAEELLARHGLETAPEKTTEIAAVMDIVRQSFEDRRAKLTQVYEEVENKPFATVANYFPLKYEKGEDSFVEEPTVGQVIPLSNRTEQGFTVARRKNVRRAPRADWLNVALEGTEEQIWYVEVQPAIDNVKALVFDRAYQAKAGRLAVNLWRQWLSAVALKGRTFTNHPWLRTLRFNVGTATLGFKLTSVLVQPLALAEAMAYVSGMKLRKSSRIVAEMRVAMQFLRAWVNPFAYAHEKSVSDMLKLREGGDFAVQEGLARLKGETPSLLGQPFRLYQKFSYSLLKGADLVTATGVRAGLLRIFKAEGLSDAEAALEADHVMNIVSGSSQVSDQPLVISTGGEAAKLVFMFKNFALNSWGILWHDLVMSGLINGSPDRKLGSLFGLALLAMAKVAADWLRDTVRQLINPKKRKERVAGGRLWDFLLVVPESVPVVGDMLQSVRKYGLEGFNIPIVRALDNIFAGAFGALNAKTEASRRSNELKSAEGIATLFGIAGTGQFFDVLPRLLGDVKERPSGEAGSAARAKRPSRGAGTKAKRPTR